MTGYTIVIIGAGSAGYVGAIRAAQMGARVCLVEAAELGGVCLNWGCIPTKTILTSAKLYSDLQKSASLGIEIQGRPSINLQRIRDRKDSVVRIQKSGIEKLLQSNGVALLRGRGRLLDPETVSVAAAEGEKRVRADRVILATGSRPRPLALVPFDGERVLSSDDAVRLSDVPERLLIVGAGAVGAEFSFIYSSLGSRVTLVEMLERALPAEDADVSRVIEREMKKRSIEFIPGCKLETVLKTGDGIKVVLSDRTERTVDRLLLSVGRAYNTEDLGLADCGVCVREDSSIQVNEKMETTCRRIYAAGDCVGGKLLAHVASEEAVVAVENCLGETRRVDYDLIPNCTFTVPEVASVGMTEEEARRSGREVSVGSFEFRALGKAHADNEIAGMVKIIAESGTDRILGAHIVGREASCLIHEVVVAMKAGIPASLLSRAVHAHPTLSEAVMEAAADVHGLSIHKLKPGS